VNGDTDASALFERYRATIAELRANNPRTTFVHVTLPLTTAQTGWKALTKRMLGRAPYGTIENLRREEYNTLLRARSAVASRSSISRASSRRAPTAPRRAVTGTARARRSWYRGHTTGRRRPSQRKGKWLARGERSRSSQAATTDGPILRTCLRIRCYLRAAGGKRMRRQVGGRKRSRSGCEDRGSSPRAASNLPFALRWPPVVGVLPRP